ncbi:hypothetical protein DICA3_B13498 [Diutina catenulata]
MGLLRTASSIEWCISHWAGVPQHNFSVGCQNGATVALGEVGVGSFSGRVALTFIAGCNVPLGYITNRFPKLSRISEYPRSKETVDFGDWDNPPRLPSAMTKTGVFRHHDL